MYDNGAAHGVNGLPDQRETDTHATRLDRAIFRAEERVEDALS
jgi:hypothetical protein